MRGDRFHGLSDHGLALPAGAALAVGAGVVLGPVVIGALAVALIGSLLTERDLDIHSHQCDACGNVWTHSGRSSLGSRLDHMCERCGAMQWWRVGELRPAGRIEWRA